MKKSDLRPVVFDILGQQPLTDFDSVEKAAGRIVSSYEPYSGLLVQEILWEMLVQGIIAPGLDGQTPGLPHIHITDYGQRCLQAHEVVPHDPDGYVRNLVESVSHPIDEIVLVYVRESLQTFLAGHYLASTVMLGVASERCIDLLTQSFSDALADDNNRAHFDKKIRQAGRSIKRRFDVLRDRLLHIYLPSELHDALDIQLSGIFTLIRLSRNAAGHPTGRVLVREEIYGNLLIFPQYCKRVYDLMQYFRTNQI